MSEVAYNTETPASEYSKCEVNREYLFNLFNTLL